MTQHAPVRVLVTSLLGHRLNTNAAIRDYLAWGFMEVLGAESVTNCPLETASDDIRSRMPDLVVAVGSLASDTTDLRRLRAAADAAGAMLAFWLHDDPYEFDYAFKADRIADIVFSNDAWAVQHYRHPNVHHMPLAGCRAVHYRPLTPAEDRGIALFFCGVAYPNRIDLLRKADAILSAHPVTILGSGWPADIACAENRRLTPKEMADYAQRSRLTLNIGRDLDIANRRFALPPSTPGPRTFEIALSGSAQLYVVSSLEIEDYFVPGEQIILVDSVRDIARALEQARDDPQTMADMARRAQQRALLDHTYVNRARRMLELCGPALRSGAEQTA